MAHCPNCKKPLHLWDISQNCPHCGVNMRFFGFDQQFYHDAKESELSMARVHVFIRTLKAAFIGGKLPIARLVAVLLPLASLLVPVANGALSFPFDKADVPLSALGLYNAFSGGVLNNLFALTDAPVNGAVVTALVAAAICVAVATLCAVAGVLTTILNFINIKRASLANCIFSAIGIVAVVAAVIFSVVCSKRAAAAEGLMVSCSLSFGWILSIIAFAAFFVVNLLIRKNGIPIELDEGMAERVEISRQVRHGKLKLEDLPQPIVETAATRKIVEEIRKEQEAQDKRRHEKEAQQ